MSSETPSQAPRLLKVAYKNPMHQAIQPISPKYALHWTVAIQILNRADLPTDLRNKTQSCL